MLDKERYLDKLVLVQSRAGSAGGLAVLRLPSVSVEGVFASAVSPPTPESIPSPIARPTVNTAVAISTGLLSPQSPTASRIPGATGLRPIDPTKVRAIHHCGLSAS